MSSVFLEFAIDPTSHAAELARYRSTQELFAKVQSQAGLSGKSLGELSDDEQQVVSDLRCVVPAFETLELVFVEPRQRGGRVTFELLDKASPKAVENFVGLVRGDKVLRDKRLAYAGSRIHRVAPGFVIQGGDFVKGDGSSGLSVFAKGDSFNDDRGGLALKHVRGTLSMANSGKKNTNTSQFFVCLADAPKLDGQHVVFGKVIDGMAIIDDIASLAVDNKDGPPGVEVTIAACGVLTLSAK
jgi:peptidylprolyl isomerase